MSPPSRLCAVDLDDTLLGADHKISARNAQAIAAVRAEGVVVVLASGRMYETTLPFVNQLDLDTPVICYNGAIVRHPRTGETWLQEQVPAELAAVVRAYATENHLQLNYYLSGHLYSAAMTPWLELYQSRTNSPIELLNDFNSALSGTTPIKMIIVDSPQRTDELLPVFRDRFAGELYVTKSNDEYLEFLPPAANKGTALAAVAARYGVLRAETVAIGDSWNDIPMLRWAGIGVAVGNAKTDVKAVAERVVATNAEDGVAQALYESFHIEMPTGP